MIYLHNTCFEKLKLTMCIFNLLILGDDYSVTIFLISLKDMIEVLLLMGFFYFLYILNNLSPDILTIVYILMTTS